MKDKYIVVEANNSTFFADPLEALRNAKSLGMEDDVEVYQLVGTYKPKEGYELRDDYA